VYIHTFVYNEDKENSLHVDVVSHFDVTEGQSPSEEVVPFHYTNLC